MAEMPPSLLLAMARVYGSDKLANSILICKIKVDNGHGPVAHCAQVPPYSTHLLISKSVLSLNLLTSQSIRKIVFSIKYFHHHGTVMCHYHCTLDLYHLLCQLPFNMCMLATSTGSLNSLSLDPNSFIVAKSF